MYIYFLNIDKETNFFVIQSCLLYRYLNNTKHRCIDLTCQYFSHNIITSKVIFIKKILSGCRCKYNLKNRALTN